MRDIVVLGLMVVIGAGAQAETLFDFSAEGPASKYFIMAGRHRDEFAAEQMKVSAEGLSVTTDMDKEKTPTRWMTFGVPRVAATRVDWYGKRILLVLGEAPSGRMKSNIALNFADAEGEVFQFQSGKEGYNEDGEYTIEYNLAGSHGKGWGNRANQVLERPLRLDAINVHYDGWEKLGAARFVRIEDLGQLKEAVEYPRTTVSVEEISTDVMYPGAAPFRGAKELRFKVEPALSGKARLLLSHDTVGPAKAGVIDEHTAVMSNGVVRFEVKQQYVKQYEFYDLTVDGKRDFKIVQAGGVFEQSEAEAMRLSCETTTDAKKELHICREGTDERVWLRVYNPCKVDIAWDTTFELSDFFGRKVEIPFKWTVPAKTAIRVNVPQPLPAKGLWRVKAVVKAGDGSSAEKETRFAYLDLHEVTPKVEKPKFRMGIHYHGTRYLPDEVDRTIGAMVAAGAKFTRTDYSHMWGDIEPRQGEYHWEVADDMIERYRAAGLACDIIMASFPDWTKRPEDLARNAADQKKGLRIRGFCAPSKPGLFRDFCEKYARRYGTKIDYYEIGNEWDLCGTGTVSHAELLRLQREAYEGLHAGCKDVCVIPNGWTTSVSQPSHDPKSWNLGLLTHFAEHPEVYDAWALHCHGDFSTFRANIDGLFLPMRESKPLKSRPWLLNETALTSQHGAEDKVARHVWMKILFGWSRGARDYIWYNLRATGWFDGGEPGYGLITPDFYPRAGYAAFSALSTIFQGLDADGILHSSPHRHLLRFRGKSMAADGVVIAGWDDSLESVFVPVKIATDAKSAAVYDMMGNATAVEIVGGEAKFPMGYLPQALVLNGATRAEVVNAEVLKKTAGAGATIPRGAFARMPTFKLEGVDCVKNLYEANPAMVHRLWKGNNDLSAKVWLMRTEKGVDFRVVATDDVHTAGDGLEIVIAGGKEKPKSYCFAAESRKGTRDVYRGSLPVTAEVFGINVKVHDDDGEGADGWVYLRADGDDLAEVR